MREKTSRFNAENVRPQLAAACDHVSMNLLVYRRPRASPGGTDA